MAADVLSIPTRPATDWSHEARPPVLAGGDRIRAMGTPSLFARYASRGEWRSAPHLADVDQRLVEMVRGSRFAPRRRAKAERLGKHGKTVLGDTNRLILQMPPRHGKSELASKHFPAWYMATHPGRDVILCSATDELATEFSAATRELLEEHAEAVFGVGMLAKRQGNSKWGLDNGSMMRSAGIGGGIMGRGADLLIIDDYCKNIEDALSPVKRKKALEWYLTTAKTRLSPGGMIVIIATRWHKDDLIGELLKHRVGDRDDGGDNWTVVDYPAIGTDGSALWPDRWNESELAKIKRGFELNGLSYAFGALYQQQPTEMLDAEFEPAYFVDVMFDDWPDPRDLQLKVTSLDPSLGKTDKADFSAFVNVALHADGTWYVEADMGRRGSQVMVEDGCELMDEFRPFAFGCESVAFQELLTEAFEEELDARGLGIHVYHIQNTIAKVTRIRGLGALLARGKIRFKSDSGGTKLLLDQLKTFPACKHDDGPDALEMGIRLANELLEGTDEDDE